MEEDSPIVSVFRIFYGERNFFWYFESLLPSAWEQALWFYCEGVPSTVGVKDLSAERAFAPLVGVFCPLLRL